MGKRIEKVKAELSRRELKGESLTQDAYRRVSKLGKKGDASVTEQFVIQPSTPKIFDVKEEEESNVTGRLIPASEQRMESIANSALNKHIAETARGEGDLRIWVTKTVGEFKISILKWIIPLMLGGILGLYAFMDHKFDKVQERITQEIKSLRTDSIREQSTSKPEKIIAPQKSSSENK